MSTTDRVFFNGEWHIRADIHDALREAVRHA